MLRAGSIFLLCTLVTTCLGQGARAKPRVGPLTQPSDGNFRCQTRNISRTVIPMRESSDLAQIWLRVQPLTRVPLRLPSYLPTESERHELFAIIESASASAYKIQLAFTQNCSGGNVCHYGTLTGRAMSKPQPSPQGKPVSLVRGLTAYFVDANCDATCPDSTLTWDENSYRYTVGLKAEKLETLKKVAESAIAK